MLQKFITKYDSYFIAKCNKSLLQNASGILLQNATVITKCYVSYKLQQYKQYTTFFLIHINVMYVSCGD